VVGLSENVVLVLLAFEAVTVKEFWVLAVKAGPQLCHHGWFWILLSRWMSSRWILSCVIKASASSLQVIRYGFALYHAGWSGC
jgi:hypothetical protein